MKPFRFALPAVVLTMALVSSAVGQGDLEGAVTSLGGVSSFSVDATVEGPLSLTASEDLSTQTLIRRAQERLQASELPVGPPVESAPNLHIHLNMMQIPSGLIAFSAEVDFFQEVRLLRNRQQVDAVTWNESVVGLVSHDMTPTIAEAVLGLVDQFAQDFRSTN